VTNGDSIEAAVEKACASFGKLDILVCNAGVQKLKPFLDMKPEDWRGLIATNLEGAISQCSRWDGAWSRRKAAA
jgi:meso-butanediol dehydrogenase/(S,S)-butanediol dehydrogenase/diacetyl reductase